MKNILVIEDSKMINNIVKKELSSFGFKIDQAFTLNEAKKLLTSKKFQLIVLDLHLPDGEGSELIANIQSLTKTKVVVLTSSQDADLRGELFEYGILDYIIKDKNLLHSIGEIVKIITTITSKSKDKILIIDDSKLICKQVKIILEPRNYIVQNALTARNGLDKLKQNEFDLLILDMELPDIHGLEVLDIIRKDIQFASIPILILSGTATPEIIRNVLKNGANDFLKKPFVFEEFILKVDLWIDYFKKDKELKNKTKQLEFVNKNLQELVSKEVSKNREKDKIMFSQSRRAQMGEMIAMIAHQWRQPLGVINNANIIMSTKMKKGTLNLDISQKLSAKISNNIKYLSETIDDFRNFFKQDKKTKEMNFKFLLDKSLLLLQESLDFNNIVVDIEIKNLIQITSYENELVQVILNLIKNAEDSLMQNKIQNPYIKIIVQDYTLKILDNGGGIPDNIIDKIFDPYFSTKLDKEGTGLGLYMSKVIIENHCQGSLNIENLHEGAMFIIDLENKFNKE